MTGRCDRPPPRPPAGSASSPPRSTPTSAAACSAGAGPPTAAAACSTPTRWSGWPGAAGRAARPAWPTSPSSPAITQISADRLRYRGLDAIQPRRHPLLRGRRRAAVDRRAARRLPGSPPGRPPRAALASAAAAPRPPCPPGTLPLERLQVIVPAMAATDPLRLHLDPPAVHRRRPQPHRRPGRLPAPAAARADDPNPDAESGPSDRGAAVVPAVPRPGPARPCSAPCRPRWCCWPTTSWPPPRWPPGPPRRCGPIPYAVVADRAGRAERPAARRGVARRGDDAGRGAGPGDGAPGRRRAAAARRARPGLRARRVPGRRPPRRPAARPGPPGRAEVRAARRGRRRAGRGHRASPCPSRTSTSPWPPWSGWPGMVRGAGEAIFAVARTAGWIAHALEAYAGPGRCAPAPSTPAARPPTAPDPRPPARSEQGQPLRVGQYLDLDDLAARDGEASTANSVPSCQLSTPGCPVDQHVLHAASRAGRTAPRARPPRPRRGSPA